VLTGEKRGSFALEGSNWFVRPARGVARADRAWPADVRLLADEHRHLRETIAALPERALGRRLTGKRYTAAFMIRGIAAHDLYHAGQIQVIKRLRGSRYS